MTIVLIANYVDLQYEVVLCKTRHPHTLCVCMCAFINFELWSGCENKGVPKNAR